MIQSKPHFTFKELTDPNFQPTITRYIDNLFIQINKSITIGAYHLGMCRFFIFFSCL